MEPNIPEPSIHVFERAEHTQVGNLFVNQTNVRTQNVYPDGLNQSPEGSGCHLCPAIPNLSQAYLTAILELFAYLQPFSEATHIREPKIAPPHSICLPGTREGVMKMILNRVRGTTPAQKKHSRKHSKKHVICLYGYEGSGKSAIAQELCGQAPRLLGSFFFSRTPDERSRIGRLPNTLSNQLAKAIPETVPMILAAVESTPDLTLPKSNLALGARLQSLVYEPFEKFIDQRSASQKRISDPYLIVIDGLDECEDKEGIQEFLDCTLKFFEKKPLVPLRVFITSRVEHPIHHDHLNSDGVCLEDLADHPVTKEDVATLMVAEFDPHAKINLAVQAHRRQHGPWPNASDARKLVEHIGGSFIFASELFRSMLYGSGAEDQESTPMARLDLALKTNSGLDALYSKTLARCERLPHRCEVISSLALIKVPLPVPDIADLLGLQPDTVKDILIELQTIMRLPGTDDCPVTFHHPSLRDFLTTESRAGCFYAPPTFHLYLFLRCFIVSLKHQRVQGLSRRSGQPPTAKDYSKQYEGVHWSEAEGVFENPIARSKIEELCSKAHKSNCRRLSESHALYLDRIAIALLEMVNNRDINFRIEWVVPLHREALELREFPDKARTSPDTAQSSRSEARASTLDNLGIALCTLFEDTGSTLAVEEAISLFHETHSLRPSPHPHLPVSLNNLGNALYAQFQQSGCIEHIVEAVEAHREALILRPFPDIDRSFSLDNLGNALLAFYEHDGPISHVEEAVVLYREALTLVQNRTSTLSNLGDALRLRAEYFRRISDHDEAISLHQRALMLLEGCPLITRRWCLMNVGIAFYSRFSTTGSVEDLKQAISFLKKSLNLISSYHIYRPKVLQYLIASLRCLSEKDNSLDSREEEIKSYIQEERALHGRPQGSRRVLTEYKCASLRSDFDYDPPEAFLFEILKCESYG